MKNRAFRDEDFCRGERRDGRAVPMTKEEIRRLSVSELEVREGDIILDIGAGTGSLTCEAARRCPKGRVYAVEKEREACTLIEKNSEKFGLENIEIINASAGESFEILDEKIFDRIFIGGSGGELGEILEFCKNHLDGIVVANFITLENALKAYHYFKDCGFDTKLIQAQISRGVDIGGKTMLIAQNPVFVLRAESKKCSS